MAIMNMNEILPTKPDDREITITGRETSHRPPEMVAAFMAIGYTRQAAEKIIEKRND